MNQNTQVATVEFHGQPLITAKIDGKVFVAMKPIVEAIGLQWEAQLKRIKRHTVLSQGMSMMDIPESLRVQDGHSDGGGTQKAVSIPIDMLNGWLFGVDANRVKPECRDKVVEYQTECFHVLNDYWNSGIAINPRMQYSVNPGDSLTKEQADILRNLLTDAAKRLPKEKQGAVITKGWSKLKAHFKCSYREIPQGEFTEAVSIIARHVAEGEYLPAGEPIDPERQARIDRRAWELARQTYDAAREQMSSCNYLKRGLVKIEDWCMPSQMELAAGVLLRLKLATGMSETFLRELRSETVRIAELAGIDNPSAFG